MKKITIILPIYKLDNEDIIMINNALLSVKPFAENVKVIIVCPENIKAQLDGNLNINLEFKIISNPTRDSDFASQINLGITNCDTEWFSILEIDDEYKKIWMSSMIEYMNAYPDVSVFLPIVKDVNVEGKFIGFMNDSVWAYGFSDKQGYLDKEILLEYQNYQTSGGLYKTQLVKDCGSFKNNIKLTFTYEFLLRLTDNGAIIMTVPKAGYSHVMMREGSLFWKYRKDENEKLSEDEVKFWIETAKKEYFFKNKRDVKYVKN